MASLSAKDLNEEIIRMRKTVEIARIRISRRLIRVMQKYEKSKGDKKQKKAIRLMEELKALKGIRNDDVAKFALNNRKLVKTRLPKKLAEPLDRAFYKLAFEDNIIKAVQAFRKKYPGWQTEVPFVLQRLGLQYRDRKRNPEFFSDVLLQDSSFRGEEEIDSLGSKANQKKGITEKVAFSNVNSFASLSNEKNTEKNPGSAKKKSKGLKKNKTLNVSNKISEAPAAFNLPKVVIGSSAIVRGQTVIKKLNLNEEMDEEETSFPTVSQIEGKEYGAPSSSFFLSSGAENDILMYNGYSLAEVAKQHKVSRMNSIGLKGKKSIDDPAIFGKKLKNNSTTSSKGQSDKFIIEDKNLHPSWAAKKQQAELMKHISTAVASKKIIFSDSD